MRYIEEIAKKLIEKHKTRDPFSICEATGLNVSFKDLGSLKGMYAVIKRNRYAVLNSSLSCAERKVTCAHELGHDILHRGFAKDLFLQDFMLYDMKYRPEYEADLFAASLLVDEDELKELIKLNLSLTDMAEALNLPPSIIEFAAKSVQCNDYYKKD